MPGETLGYFTKDPAFFKSIFIDSGGDGGIDAEARALEQYEAARWRDLVVVDDINFYAGQESAPGRRYGGVLFDPPKKRALKALYSAKRPLIANMPKTIFPRDGQDFDFAKNLRPQVPAKWVARDGGEPVDFVIKWTDRDSIMADNHKSTVRTKVTEAKPLTEEEKIRHAALFRRVPLVSLPPVASPS